MATDLLPVGDVSARAGLTVATLRYYESRGLSLPPAPWANQRRYPRRVWRRLAFVAAARHVDLTLDEIGAALATCPPDRAPTRQDWRRLSGPWRRRVDAHREARSPARHPRRLRRV